MKLRPFSRGGGAGAVADKMVAATSKFFDQRLSRRGFISRATIAGSAVAASGCVAVTQPGSPYTFVTDCPGGLCRDGYTEFCCVINNGVNACPPNSFPAGWWRADYSVFCNGTRYYIDCNDFTGAPPPCRCAVDCNTRKVYCNHFRYGSCNDHIPGTGVIACRLVLCVPPYFVAELGCTPSGAVDNSTAGHYADCAAYTPAPPPPPPPPPPSSPPAVLPSIGGVVSDAGEITLLARLSTGAVGAVRRVGGVWGAWETLALPGVTASSRVVAASAAPGTVDAFVLGSDRRLYWQHFEAGAWAAGWSPFSGNLASDPAVSVVNGDLQVLTRTVTKATRFLRRSAGVWSSGDLGGVSTSDPTSTAGSGELHAFVRGSDARTYTKRFTGAWSSSWADLGGHANSDPSAAFDGSAVHLFARGAGDKVWTRTRTPSAWSDWLDLGGPITSDPVGVATGSVTWVFARWSDNTLRFRRRHPSGAWSGWESAGRPAAGGLTTDPLVVADGSTVVAFARVGGDLHTCAISGGAAGPWEPLPTGVVVAPVRGAQRA